MFPTTTFVEAFVAVVLAASTLLGLSDTTEPAAPDTGGQGDADGRIHGEMPRNMHGRMMRDSDMAEMHRQMMRDPQMRDMRRHHMGSTGMGLMHGDPADPSNELAHEKRTS